MPKSPKKNPAMQAEVVVPRDSVVIKKVILENFLSFQKDEVDFSDEKTGIPKKFIIIVGPNWSGKTSIFQAIKFALGSNERDERYKKWERFIRNEEKHAMVELHLLNGDELIQIRRSVIRGQSPFYSIKRKGDTDFKKAQALEIQKLIADLNINPENQFAFVSQGKIDAIKSLKPITLSTFLEEGIGLKGLREEILQQQNKVKSLNNDLNALKTKKSNLTFNLDLLKPKLERLAQKKKLLEVKKGFTDELLWANRKKVIEGIAELEEKIEKLLVIIEEYKGKLAEAEKEIQKIQKKIAEIEDSINKNSEQLGEHTYRKKELAGKIQSWQQGKVAMKQELDNLGEKLNKQESSLNNVKKQKESLENELESINKEKQKIEKKIDELITEQGELAKKIQKNKKFLDEYNKIVEDKNGRKSSIKNNETQIKAINDEINQLFQSFKDIEHKFEVNKWFLKDPSENLLKSLDREINGLSNKSSSLNSELKELEKERSKKFIKLKPLQSALSERRIVLPSEIAVLREEIKKISTLQSVKGPLIDYLKYDDNLSYAIESVIGEYLLYSFIADNWDSFTLLKKLKNKYNAQCDIYLTKSLKIEPLTKISASGTIGYLAELINIIGDDSDIKKVIYSKIKNCLVVNDFQAGKDIYKKTSFSGKCVTLDGEQIVSYKYAYESPHTKRLKGFLSPGTQKEQAIIYEKEIKALTDRISELNVEISKLDQKQRETYKKKEIFHDLLFSFKAKQRLTAKKNQFYGQRSDLEKNSDVLREELKVIEDKIKQLESQMEPEIFKINERFEKIPSELETFKEQKNIWEKKSKENQDLLKEVDRKINSQTSEFNLLEAEYKTKKDTFQKADKEAFAIYRELEELDEKINDIQKIISKLKEDRSGFELEKSDYDKRNVHISLDLEQENIKLNSINQQLLVDKESLNRINSQIGPLIAKDKIKIRSIEEINDDIKAIDKELLKYYDVDESLLVEKERIVDSLKELAKNQQFIENDINAALTAGNKMEDTYNDQFKTVLNDLQNRINTKFESSNIKTYCQLSLTGNFNELGVEIKAATSKSSLMECTALSGGQISMISIGLILSLQEIKPSPLCMIDEAGMFLDEKNAETAYQLIKTTLEKNPIQMLIYLPQSSNRLFLLAEKIIGVARTGANEVSSVFKPKIIEKK